MALLPCLPFKVSIEVLNARDHIVEIIFFGIEPLTPFSVPAAMNGPAGVAAMFVFLGAVFGFGASAAAFVSAAAAMPLGFLLQAGGRTATAIVLTTAVLAGGWALRPQSRPESDSVQPIERVVLIGVDGLSLNVLNPLLDEGSLPNIKRLIAEGAAGPLRATLPIRSPIIWTSIATGRRALGHGIH